MHLSSAPRVDRRALALVHATNYRATSDTLENRHKPSHIILSQRSDVTNQQSEIGASQIALQAGSSCRIRRTLSDR
eukprot:scaffold15871_cov80-Skeletonema_marinoi.AAC.1